MFKKHFETYAVCYVCCVTCGLWNIDISVFYTVFLGFLECTDGTIIKPCQLPPRGTREMHFYQTVFNPESNEPELIRLRKLLPEYLGMVDVKEHPDSKLHTALYSKSIAQPVICVCIDKIF